MFVKSALQRISRPNVLRPNVSRPNVGFRSFYWFVELVIFFDKQLAIQSLISSSRYLIMHKKNIEFLVLQFLTLTQLSRLCYQCGRFEVRIPG